MPRRRNKNPSRAEAIQWALRKIGRDDYHFDVEGSDGGWELNVWEYADAGDMTAEERGLLMKIAQGIVDGRVEPRLFLQGFVEDKDWKEGAETAELLKSPLRAFLGHYLLKTRRAVGGERAADFESGAVRASPEDMRDNIALALVSELGSRFERMVSRAEELRILPTRMTVPETVQRYMDEASKCYISGQFLACLLVCRSVLIFGLKDYLRREGRQSEVEAVEAQQDDGVGGLVRVAKSAKKWKMQSTLDAAWEVGNLANKAVHKGAPSPDICRDLYVRTRGVVGELFA